MRHEVGELPSVDEAMVAELAAIKAEDPAFNVAGRQYAAATTEKALAVYLKHHGGITGAR